MDLNFKESFEKSVWFSTPNSPRGQSIKSKTNEAQGEMSVTKYCPYIEI